MTLRSLAWRALRHHWRTNLAATLGLATAAAVLGGAWTTGESVRGSLRELALARLGRATHALVAEHFFREAIAPGAPLIAVEAVITHEDSRRRATRVALYGVDARFYELHQRAVHPPRNNEALISPALARELGAQPNDTLLVRIERISAVPGDTVHGRRDDPGRTLRAAVRGVATRDAMGEFSLSPGQGDVRAIFLPLARLQREFAVEGRVNTLISTTPVTASNLQVADAGLMLRNGQLEHESLVIPDALVAAIRKGEPRALPVLTYLANTIRVNGREVPYSLIAARDEPGLADNSILLTDWVRDDTNAAVGDSVELQYYVWESQGRLSTGSAKFNVAGFTPVRTEDRDLAPEYPGISGAETVAEWDPPFPIELKRIRQRDEDYWNRHRATPKAYISLAAGRRLWQSKYGSVTSLRVPPDFNAPAVISRLTLAEMGLTVLDVRSDAEQASRGSTDFGEYFLYFSFFLIVSALLLAGLFFRLGLEQRASEISLLRSVGFAGKHLRTLFLTEALSIAVIGGLLGIVGMLLYSGALLYGLRTWWNDAVGTRDLSLHLGPAAFFLALGSTLTLGPLVVWFSLRSYLKQAPRESRVAPARARFPLVAVLCAVAGIALVLLQQPGAFFGSGALLLTACLLFWRWWLRRAPGQVSSLPSLGVRYTAARPGRSMLCVALIASAVFLIVAVDAFRRAHDGGEPGWRYYAESSLPLYHNPTLEEGREALGIPDAPETRWLAFKLRPGDDASCLNLYAPRNPRVVGIPESYRKLPADTGNSVPAAVDANTLQYVLHRKVGDVIDVGGAKLQIVEALRDSVFQSELLISESDFERVFPQEGGFRVFLVDAPPGAEGTLEEALADFGFDMTTTAERLAAYHRVESTWLSTFQALGGLGLLLGTVGLAAVLLRNVLERRRELALLRATGYTPVALRRVILSENLALLFTGLAAGTVSALVAVVPTVLQRGGSVPWVAVVAVIAAVLLTGAASSVIALRAATRAPLLDALRSE